MTSQFLYRRREVIMLLGVAALARGHARLFSPNWPPLGRFRDSPRVSSPAAISRPLLLDRACADVRKMAQLRGSPGTMALAVYGTFATKGMQWMWNFGGVEISGVLGRRLSRAGDPGVGGRDVDREMVRASHRGPPLEVSSPGDRVA